MAPSAKDELLAVYLDRRATLVRAFTARAGSLERAEDIVQDIFVRLQAQTDVSAEEVRNPLAFLYRIGGNLLLDGVRQRKRASARDESWSDVAGLALDGAAVDDQPSPEDTAWARLKLEQVMRALEDMPPNARLAFRLNKIDGLTHAEIAERMGMSRSSIEKYLSATLVRLLDQVGWP